MGETMAELFLEISRYYNSECAYRKDIEVIVQNYDKIAGMYIKKVYITHSKANLLDKNAVLIEEIFRNYDTVPILLKEFQGKRKNYNHYTQKIKELEKEKQIFEDSGKGNYSKKDLEKLLRVLFS
jgi:predicted patatin/cPLA2 family phospholipase